MLFINIYTNSGSQRFFVADIIRIEASNNYSRIYFRNQKFPLLTCKVLHWFENNLMEASFIRTHKSHLVNPGYIQAFCNSSNKIILNTGENIAVSRRKISSVKKQLIGKVFG